MTKELLIEILTHQGNLYPVIDNFIYMHYGNGNDYFACINKLYIDTIDIRLTEFGIPIQWNTSYMFISEVANLIYTEISEGKCEPEFINYLYTFCKVS